MTLDYHRQFVKMFKKLPEKVKSAARERIDLFQTDQWSPLLNNHSLGGKYKGCRSINITGDYRAVFTLKEESFAVFLAIGTHSQLYK